MNKISFHQIRNIDGLFNMLEKCVGAVYITSSECDQIDLRNNLLIRELLIRTCQKHGIETLDVALENGVDLPRMINYLMACNCAPAIKQGRGY